MKRKKSFLIILLILSSVLLSGVTYAYWASSITASQASDEEVNVIISEGEIVTTKVNVSRNPDNNLKLVPVGREQENLSVSKVEFTYSVKWNESSDEKSTNSAKGVLSVDSTLSGLEESELSLFTVSKFDDITIEYGSETIVKITIEFTTEPSDYEQYLKVINKELTLTVKYTLNNIVA